MKRISRYVLFVHLFVSLVFSSHVIYGAEEFQAELSTSYFHFEDDVNNERTEYTIAISQYFSPVHTDGHPLEEAAFLERMGRIGLFVAQSEFEFQSFLGATEGDGLSYSAIVTIMKPNRPLFLQFFYAKSDDQFDTIFIGDIKRKRYFLDAGLFIMDGFLINVEYDRFEADRSRIFSLGNDVFLFEERFKDTSFSIEAKFVKKLRNETAINLQGQISINEFEIPGADGTNNIGQISGEYYLNHWISIGLSLTTNSGDEEAVEGETYATNILVYLNPHVSVEASYTQFYARNATGVDRDFYFFTSSARF